MEQGRRHLRAASPPANGPPPSTAAGHNKNKTFHPGERKAEPWTSF